MPLLSGHGAALAHVGPPPAPERLWATWSWDPSVLLGLVIVAFAYTRGLRQLWRRAGTGRGVAVWRADLFMAGLATLFVALVSPLDGLSSALFSAHMVQHLLLILVVAPLLVLGKPSMALLWALPLPQRRALGRVAQRAALHTCRRALNRPWLAWLLAAIVLWVWHLPLLYEAALRHQFIHFLEHLCLLGSSLLFWEVLIDRSGSRQFGYGFALAYIFAMAVQSTALGIILTFSHPWYTAYAATTGAWELSPQDDQQIAGLIMWIPASAIYLIAGLTLIVTWFRVEERETRSHEGLSKEACSAQRTAKFETHVVLGGVTNGVGRGLSH
ncbi:MAG: cytochrome c oxidase assembly protein, partial [Dehalococcoidia bacterium]